MPSADVHIHLEQIEGNKNSKDVFARLKHEI